MGILAALDSASGQTSTSGMKNPGIVLADLTAPKYVQLGGPGTSQSLQGTTFVYASTPQQTLQAVNQAASTVLNSPQNKTVIVQANNLAGIATVTVQSASASKQAGIFGATGASGTVSIKAAGSGSVKTFL